MADVKKREELTCKDCRFAIFQDVGYSNWTVTGTDFYCAKGIIEDIDDVWYEEPKLDAAKTCQGFEAGGAIELDVDDEALEELTEQERAVLTMLEQRHRPP